MFEDIMRRARGHAQYYDGGSLDVDDYKAMSALHPAYNTAYADNVNRLASRTFIGWVLVETYNEFSDRLIEFKYNFKSFLRNLGK